ncbi:hypothetical protein QBC41DRAFT_393944, partial [Cercophora samala]
MANSGSHDVVPDSSLLKAIFGDNEPLNVSIVRKDADSCIFKAIVPIKLGHGHHSCFVRLEALTEQPPSFYMAAAMQEIASSCIEHLVPETIQVGTATNDQKIEFQFWVMELVKGNSVEDAWDQMDDENRISVVKTLVKVLSSLQYLELSDWKVQNILQVSLGEHRKEEVTKAVLGGPLSGFMDDAWDLLSFLVQSFELTMSNRFHTIESMLNPDGVEMRSTSKNVDSVRINDVDIDRSKEAVFCHNDIRPQNIMVRKVHTDDGQVKYELTGLVNWGFAGFYPPSFQLSLQDIYLGVRSRHLSFYLLLKQELKATVPRTPSQMSLSKTILHLFAAQQEIKLADNNVEAHLRRRYIAMMRLSWDKDPYVGWKRDVQGPVPEMSAEDFNRLKKDVFANNMWD